MARVGWLEVCGLGPRRPNFDIFRARLAELGYVEGKNLIFEQRFAKERPDALFVYPDVVLSSYPRPQQLADFAIKSNLPTVHAFRFFVEAGGLMSYGATQSEIYGIAAEQVAKILNGARPSDLPLRQATRFELVINKRTAKALGPTIPQSLLLRTDQVVE